ncbi:MAG TPA: MFS transporter, partial [Saprospiraceae bacterium]|nr:MFS transporter [Saprospiraceae bacterium]
MNTKLWLRSIIVALAGFLFGFDTVVISGAENALQNLWQTSDIFHGNVVVASALWGTVLGALLGNIPTDRIGRKKTLILIGILYTL